MTFAISQARWSLMTVTLCALFWVAWVSQGQAQGLQPAPRSLPPALTPRAAKEAKSTSGSGQFVVYGSDLGTRGAFCTLCDDTANALGKLLRDDARYDIPVVVVLKAPPDVDRMGPAVSTSIMQLDPGGFHLQINAQLRSDFQSEEFARELVRVLLAERILRKHAELKTNRDRVLPDWVLTGVTQALEFRSRSRPSAMFAAVFKGGQIFSIDKLLTADPAQLDALSRTIYETSSCAIVLALLEQQDGPVRFGRFLNALALDNKSDRDLLKQHFPTLGVSKNSLEKWWTLQMATLATPSPLESLSVEETEKRLDEAITLRYEPLPDKKGKVKEEPKTAQNAAVDQTARFADAAWSEARVSLRGIADLMSLWISGQEVAAKTTDTDDSSTKKDKDKDKDKDKANAKDPKKGETKDAKKGETKDAKKGDVKEEKKPAEKGKKEEPKLDKKEADKKAAADKKEADKKAAEKKEADQKAAKEAAKAAELAKKDQEKKDKEKKEQEKKDLAKKESDKKEPDKKEPDKKKEKEKEKEAAKISGLKAEPHRVAQRPAEESKEKSKGEEPADKKELANTKESKDKPAEDSSGEKRNKWNPANWFKGKPKPEPETAAKEVTPSKSSHPQARPEAKPEPKPGMVAAQGSLKDFSNISKRPDRSKILQRNLDLLNTLKNQAHPLYRPLIADYTDVVKSLILGKEHGAADKLVALQDRYTKVSNKAKSVESYLDWYEASETQSYSGAFDDYLKLRDKLDKEIHSRGDALSQYLDTIEKEYEN